MDSIGTFIGDCLEIDVTQKWRLPTKLLYETYLKWCTKNNERAMCQKSLSIRMQEKGFKRMATNGQRVWMGLLVRNEWLA